MKTASWFTPVPADHIRIGISRAVPRRFAPGYRVFRALAPGPWFNAADVAEYDRLYRAEVLASLEPRATYAAILELAAGREPVLCCYEKPDGPSWCHRALAARWFADALGEPVPELGYEQLPQHDHPLLPAPLRRQGTRIPTKGA